MAGKSLDEQGHVGGWIRPVTGSSSESLPYDRTVCSDGHPTSVMDVIAPHWDIPVPQLHQRENRLLGVFPLQRCGRVGWNDLPVLADPPGGSLWLDGCSSGSGLNDRVPVELLDRMPDSLRLLRIPELRICRTVGYEGRIKNRAIFAIGASSYNLALTDMVAIGLLETAPSLLLDAYVSVSLAVPLGDGFAYKVAAAVITQERAEGMA